jgi:hypothetical protein
MALGTTAGGVVFGVAAVERLGGSLKRPTRGVLLPVDTAAGWRRGLPAAGDEDADATSGGCCGDGLFIRGGPPPGGW